MESPDVGSQRESLALRLWWVFPLVLLVTAAIAAMCHRERPLSLDQLDPQVLAAVPRAAASTPIGSDTFVRRHRTQSAGMFGPSQGIDKATLRHLGGGLFLRSDDSYELRDGVQGQRAVFEERAITWRGLLTLQRAEREPAAIYHDIFADEGWLVQTTASLQVQVDDDFPRREGSRLHATLVRVVPAAVSASAPKRFERRIDCLSDSTVDAAAVLPGGIGRLPRVVCDGVQRPLDVDARLERAATTASRGEYVHLPEPGYFLLTSWSNEEPRHPYDSDDAPRRRSENQFQLLELKTSPAETSQRASR